MFPSWQVDRQIDLVKNEINRHTKYGRQGVKRGCGLWCLGYFIGCNCGLKTSQVAEIMASVRGELDGGEIRTLGYDNKGLQVSDWNLDEAAQASNGGEVAPSNGSPAIRTEDDADTSDITVAVEAYHEPPKYSTAIAHKAAATEKAGAVAGAGVASGVAVVAGVAAGVAASAGRRGSTKLSDADTGDDHHDDDHHDDDHHDDDHHDDDHHDDDHHDDAGCQDNKEDESDENCPQPISMKGDNYVLDGIDVDQDGDYTESTMM